jgi:hypothetical protein
MSNGRHDVARDVFLAGVPLPSFVAFISTTPANEHMPASGTLYKLNGSYNAWCRIILGACQ